MTCNSLESVIKQFPKLWDSSKLRWLLLSSNGKPGKSGKSSQEWPAYKNDSKGTMTTHPGGPAKWIVGRGPRWKLLLTIKEHQRLILCLPERLWGRCFCQMRRMLFRMCVLLHFKKRTSYIKHSISTYYNLLYIIYNIIYNILYIKLFSYFSSLSKYDKSKVVF